MTSTADLVNDSGAVGSENGKTTREISFKTLKIREIITVEPIFGAYLMAAYLCLPTIYRLEFEKACRSNLDYNDTVCEAIISGQFQNYTKENKNVQLVISDIKSWQQPVQSVMPLIMVLFLGSFSDRHQWRKPFLIMPLFGEILAVVGCILSVFFMKSWSLEIQGVVQLVVPSFFGGQPMITMAGYAYIADVSTIEMRTLRIGVVQIVVNVIVPITQLFSAHMFILTGYYGVFVAAGALYVFGFVYGYYWIKEPRQPLESSEGGLLRDIFNPRHAIDTVNLIFKKSPGNNRLYIILLLIVVFVYTAVTVGEVGLFYLYAEGLFSWTELEFSYFITVNTVVHLIGTAVGVPLFTKILHLSDTLIIFLTFINKIISNFVFGFANTGVLLYAAVVVSITTGITPIGIRSLQTKIVSEEDLGKAQSLFGLCEAVAPAVATPMYNTVIYNNTITSFPAAYFFFGILLYIIASGIIMWIYLKQRSGEVLKINKDTELGKNGIDNKAMETYVETTHI